MDFGELPIFLECGIIHKKDFDFQSTIHNKATYAQKSLMGLLREKNINVDFSTKVESGNVIKLEQTPEATMSVVISESNITFNLTKVRIIDLNPSNLTFSAIIENLELLREGITNLILDYYGMRFGVVFPYSKVSAGQVVKQAFFQEVARIFGNATENTETELIDFGIITRGKDIKYNVRITNSNDNRAVTTWFEIDKVVKKGYPDIKYASFASYAVGEYRERFSGFADKLMKMENFNEALLKSLM